MSRWTRADIPAQSGRRFVVTGTGGLGFETAQALALAGAEVIVAGRDPGKGADAVKCIAAAVPAAVVRFELLDLADLASIAAFAGGMAARGEAIDGLINNAGVMVPPVRKTTADGFELQFGTNYLGHFALTAHLMPLLRLAKAARVVTISSVAARGGAIDFDDLNAEQGYKPMPVYSQSKLACLMFAFELDRRSVAGGWGVRSMAAHPGISRTDLLHNGPGRNSIHGRLRSLLPFLFQPAEQGALPGLFAATSPRAQGGGYYGPDRLGETRGYPVPARVPAPATDQQACARLWAVSEAMARISFDAAR
ncbi:SDR family oxidoreductase [Sphingomonas sp.]|uniref:SDR family oxidoreductase n=1 Tax=Sphingomonas sp. TaxID=28214 RepID=UPI002C1B30A5|nr:SDR family oxidoreductase [Sphingomonas sp.]HTG37659.1 SDR family oxidoreductase [Sphingomonas sp.]